MKSIVKYFIPLLLAGISFESLSQARVIINNDAYITLDGGTAGTPIYLVVENPAANAITTSGTGGNIVSEGEYNKVRWNIGTNTGTYILPWYSQLSAAGMKMPLTVDITGAGVGGTEIDFSTYRTSGAGSSSNAPLPSMVTHFLDAATASVNNEDYVVDRFWLIDAGSYGTRPTSSLTMVYDNSVEEIASGNLLIENNLVAQRFNSGTNAWDGDPNQTQIYYGLGTLNTGARTLGPFAVTPAELFEAWVLVDRTNILPVEMLDISSTCNTGKNTINWSTASETDNDYFTIERSTDGYSYSPIGSVASVGNTTSVTEYSYIDNTGFSGSAYYRVVQTDINGEEQKFDPIISNCSLGGTNIISNFSSNGNIGLNVQSDLDQFVGIDVLDLQGKLVSRSNHELLKGDNELIFGNTKLAAGIYLINLKTDHGNSVKKIYIGN